jgi:MGT family glycosyltransferase
VVSIRSGQILRNGTDNGPGARRTGNIGGMSALHVAFLPFPASGHINTTLPIVSELKRRGHRVTFATNARFSPVVAAAGADVLRYESWLASRPLPDSVDADYMAHEPVRSINEAIDTVPLYEAGFAGDLPDVLLYDVSTFAAGRVLAHKWKRPAIELFATFASNEHYSLTERIGAMYADQIDPQHPALLDFFVKMDELLRRHGLDHVTLKEFLAPAEEANLIFLPRSFQPAHETFDDRFAFVGTSIGARRDEPGWTPPEPGTPTALVSMGTFALGDHLNLVRTCLEAFAGTPWHAVVVVGDRVNVQDLGSVPSNVELMPWAPQLAALDRADVFVSHAGMNSVMESMYFGTPVVAIPHMPEQRIVADRLVELGLGTRLQEDELSPELLREAVNRVAGDAPTGARVGEMRNELRAVDGPSRATDYIEKCALVRPGGGPHWSSWRAPIG